MLNPGSALLTLCLIWGGARHPELHHNVMGLAKASLEANVRYMATLWDRKGLRPTPSLRVEIRTLAASA